MEERREAKPRKVRFKLASSYSGRVLKHVYEDGQELDSPEEKYPHSFIHTKIPQHLDAEQLCSFEEVQGQAGDPPTGLIAQRINVYRAVSGFGPAASSNQKVPVLDFEKIIIYTSNLRIIRSPGKRAERQSRGEEQGEAREKGRGEGGRGEGGRGEGGRGEGGRGEGRERQGEGRGEGRERQGEGRERQGEGRGEGREGSSRRESRSKGRHRTKSVRKEERRSAPKVQEAGGCGQCGGSGSAPCSRCHGSKLSMLANRFNESIRELRCPACDPQGLEPCQSCVRETYRRGAD